jgi:transposase
MDVMVERCAGIDIGKAEVLVCVRTPGVRRGTRHSEVRRFGTTTRSLLTLADWLRQERVSEAWMESTGVYWKPVFFLLEAALEQCACNLANPQHVKNVPGRKSDVNDAQWLCQLAEHGLIRPSFVPPQEIRQLRDLTRYRASLVHDRTREANRLHKTLEDAGIKLDCVATDILGVSGRSMIEALIGGQRDPEQLADLARNRLRIKIPQLVDALTGRFTDHHGRLCRLMLDHIDALSATIATLDAQLEEQMEPFRDLVGHLITIPGVGLATARVIIAETGADMSRFATPDQLSSWAGMCPGNNESAGKHKSTRVRPGNVWLKAALGEAAFAASRSKHTYLSERYARLAHRRGKKRAVVATGRMILEASWQIMTRNVDYTEVGAEHYLRTRPNKERRASRLMHELQVLGYEVTLNPVA